MSRNRYQKARLSRKDEIDFLRDIDLLTSISSDEQSFYRQADIDIGQEMMSATYVLKQDNTKYKLSSHIDEFRIFGPGIYLLFKLLKYLTISFGIVSIFSFVNLGLLLSGPNPRQSEITNQIKAGILKTTVYNLTSSDYSSYVGISFTIIVIFSLFLVYWSEKQKQYVIQCLKVTPLASYSTVILKKLPKSYNQHKLQLFLTEKFGDVAEIYTVRNFGDDLLYYKQMNEIAQDYKKEKVLTRLQPSRRCNKQASLFFEFRSGHLKIKQKIKDSETFQSVFAFIRFKKVEDRQKLLQVYNQINLFCCLKIKSEPKQIDDIQKEDNNKMREQDYSFQQMNFIQCEMQPCGILWQNLHLTNSKVIFKTGLMILLMVIVLSLSIFLIFLISVIQMSVMNSKFKDMSKQQVQNQHDDYALLSFCINLSFSKFYQQSDICSVYNSDYIKFTIMIFMIPLSISLFKLLLTELMKALVIFRRYAYEIKKIQSQTTIIFVFYFLVTGVLQLVIYLGNDSTSIFQLFTPLIQSIVDNDFQPQKVTLFLDYDPNWYLTASYNVVMIGAISFNLSAIGIIFYCKLRRKIFDYYANKQKLQIQMNKWLTGYVLQIEYIYAALLTIVYFTLLFGGSMPLLYPLSFVSFLILYWSNKYVFINFCAKPLIYSHSINRRVRKILFGALIMHCVFTPVFLRAPLIGQFQTQQNFIQRILSLWQYIVLLTFLLSYLIFEQPTRVIFALIKQYNKSRRHQQKKPSGEEMPLPHPIHRKGFSLPTIVRKRHNQLELQSYSMHNNTNYKQILRTLYTINNKQRARKTCVLNKQLFHLYQENRKTSDQDEVNSPCLAELIKLAKRDFKRYGKKNKHNPYYILKNKLYQISENSKKGKNHKYTLFNGSGLRDMYSTDGFDTIAGDNFQSQQSSNLKQELQIQSKIISNSKYLTKQNLSNLEQVIEAASNMEDESQQKSRRMSGQKNYCQTYKHKAQLSHFANQGQVQIPQSGKRLTPDSS